jgi:hypothetical protein
MSGVAFSILNIRHDRAREPSCQFLMAARRRKVDFQVVALKGSLDPATIAGSL